MTHVLATNAYFLIIDNIGSFIADTYSWNCFYGAVVCSQDTECGLGGKCYGGRCGCLTTSCSGVAYAAMQGCQYFCQCNDATKKWEIQKCSPGTLFDEMYPATCNFPYLVGNETCYHGKCNGKRASFSICEH